MTRSCGVNAFNYDWTEDAGYANPPGCLIPRVLRKLCAEGARVMLVFHEWPNAPWYPIVRELELRSFLVTSPCYLSPRMYLRPKPRWNTRIAIVDGAAATPRVHRSLGTQPQAKRVRFNHQTVIRHIPSCKEPIPTIPTGSPPSPPTQAPVLDADGISAFGNQPDSSPKEADFHSTLKTDPKPPN